MTRQPTAPVREKTDAIGRMCSCCGRRIADSEASYIHLGPGRELCWTCAPKGLQSDYTRPVMPHGTE